MDELLKIEEVSERLKCSKNFVYELMNSGLLPYLKLGSKKVRSKSIDIFLEEYDGWNLSDPYNPVKING